MCSPIKEAVLRFQVLIVSHKFLRNMTKHDLGKRSSRKKSEKIRKSEKMTIPRADVQADLHMKK